MLLEETSGERRKLMARTTRLLSSSSSIAVKVWITPRLSIRVRKRLTHNIEALKQLLIIERTPSPSPSVASESEVEIDDDEEELTDGLTPAQQRTIATLMKTFVKQNSRSSVASSSRSGSSARMRLKVMKKATTIKKEKPTMNTLREMQKAHLMSKKKGGKPKPEVIDLVSEDENEDGDEDEEPIFVPRRGTRVRGMFYWEAMR